MSIRPFQYRAAESALEDLRARLRATRWVEGGGEDWMYGFATNELRRICRHWAEEFDWRAVEARMLRWPQFVAEFAAAMGGTRVHFLHIRGRDPEALPLLLTHGWPGSFLEFSEVIPRLAEHDLVIPSLPGFGFSSRPAGPGCNLFAIAELWAALMRTLGYERYGVQGGDFGASVSTILGWKHAEAVAGAHLNYIPGSYQPDIEAGAKLSREEEEFLRERARWAEANGAYAHVQRREPLTLAQGLNDSPGGLAAWMLQRFRDWSDCDGELASRFQLDDLLANVTLYWLTGTMGSAMRLYRETSAAPVAMGRGERVRVPTAVARFAKEAPFPPRSWVERGYDVARWSEMPRGGHFAAMEEPEALAGDMRAFFAGR